MSQIGLPEKEIEQNRTKLRSRKSSRFLFVIGLLLLLPICFAGAVTDADIANPPLQDLNGTSVPAIQTVSVSTILTTPTQDMVAALTAQPTAATQMPAMTKATTATDAPDALVTTALTETPDMNGVPLIRTGTAGVDQYTIRTTDNLPTQEEKEAAAANYKTIREAYLKTGIPSLKGGGDFQIAAAFNGTARPVMDPGGIPHYFGPYPNWANSPMPMGNISNITIDDPGRFYTGNATVTITDAYFTGSGATATALVVGDVIQSITVTNGGTNYTAPVVIIEGTGTGAAATAHLGGPYYSGMRKFVDTLPQLGSNGANNLGQYIPVAQKDTTSFTPPPASDYYEIAVVQFTEKMHSDLPETTLRGYVQISTPVVPGIRYPLNYPNGTNITDIGGNPVYAVDKPHYLGPIIVATNGTPVRVKFYNYLPIGAEGNLFIPVDTTVMGSGMGPQGMNVSPVNYTQNRATLHLHGGATPWISDGTPYQWITPANEYTAYPEGVSVYNVPGMPDDGPRDGSQTFYYTNQQSARLMFYHDHSHGITRLNVYAGEAAGYLVTDLQEQDMIAGTDVTGINTGINAAVLPDIGIPLVIQDRTWVDANTIAAQDPTWYWGADPGAPRTGDLWYPHVYMTAQNPFDRTGVNAYGRWHYGPWFFPPTVIPHLPVANPHFGDINYTGEPPQIPGVPHPSTPGEAFMDTPTVNGVAYPNLTVEPRAYRFRILNAANDRAFNLGLYVADANVTTADGRNNTEVLLVPRTPTPGFPSNWPVDNRPGGSPHPSTIGPSFIMIGSEGGFLPAPVVVPNQPITFIDDPTLFNVGNVDKHSLLLMSAERADVIVDFSAYAGKTLILYNDAPAAFPARVPQYDYYTGAEDLTSTGGAPTTQPGYGPNTRTIMQIKVNNTAPAAPYNLAALESVFAKTAAKRGVFESSQPPVIVSDEAYNSAYNTVFTQDNYVRIGDEFKNFTTINGTWLNLTLQPKAIHDEMGGVYDNYGRMSGMLGLEVAGVGPLQRMFVPFGYSSPPTDVVMTSLGEYALPQLGDGTQLWKITHNGVDSHPVHWHMYNVQLINRVPWDGLNIAGPDPTELGWKETIRVSPLEDTIVALKPVAVTVPFPVPDKVRAIDPTMPLGNFLTPPPGDLFFSQGGNPVNPNGVEGQIRNHLVNYGWEYVWHCHILAHEEMDMMHAQAISVNNPGTAPDTLRSNEVYNATTDTTAVYLRWIDRSTQETDWIIQRTNVSETNWTDFKTVPSYSKAQTPVFVMAIDNSIPTGTVPNYSYRVMAANIVGDDYGYNEPVDPGELQGYPLAYRNSTVSNTNISLTTALPGAVTFGASPNTGDAPLNVSFTGTSSGATGWSWDFGDGNFADDNGKQNPNHVYELPGTYTVTLTAMTLAGNATSGTQTIVVTQAPVPPVPTANFTATPTVGVAPLTVIFTDTSTSDPPMWAGRRWSFGDGTFSSLKNVNHTYTAGGIYTVSLVASNLGGTDVVSSTINVTVLAPAANFTATPTTGNTPLTVAFTDLSINGPTTWNWTFGDGSTAAIKNPVHIYTTAGAYDVSLNASNSGGFSTFTRPAYINVTGAAPFSVGIYRPSVHTFYLKNGTGPTTAINWGISTDLPVTGDWNGNGVTDVGIYRPSTHMFYLRNGTTTAVNWGISTDLPVTGDWNGNGVTDVGIYRPSTHMFYLRNGTTTAINWGISTDLPVTGDWNGDRITDVGVYRQSVHTFYLKNGTGPTTAINWGISTDLPVTGDWNGDGVTDVGIYRPSAHTFYLKNGTALSWTTTAINWGISTDLPVTGKWS